MLVNSSGNRNSYKLIIYCFQNAKMAKWLFIIANMNANYIIILFIGAHYILASFGNGARRACDVSRWPVIYALRTYDL